MMYLTREQAITWHRKMWMWISKEIARSKKVMSVSHLKFKFCTTHNVYPAYCCFCCEYSRFDCDYCILLWGNDTSKRCVDAEYKTINHLYNECVLYDLCESEKNVRKQAKLAYKIAMLPEREDF